MKLSVWGVVKYPQVQQTKIILLCSRCINILSFVQEMTEKTMNIFNTSKMTTNLASPTADKSTNRDNNAKIASAMYIENLVMKNSLFAPSKLDPFQFERQIRPSYNPKLITIKKQISPHNSKIGSMHIGKSSSSLVEDKKVTNIQLKHRKNISAIWLNRKGTKQKKSQKSDQSMQNFYLQKVNKHIYCQLNNPLKMEIKKMESFLKPQEAAERILSRGKYRLRNFLPKHDNLEHGQQKKNQIDQIVGSQYKLNDLSSDLPDMKSEQKYKYSLPLKQQYRKQRYIKSTLISYSSKTSLKKNKQSIEQPLQMLNIKNLITQNQIISEENIEFVLPQKCLLAKTELSIEKDLLNSYSAQCISVYYINKDKQRLLPIFLKNSTKKVEIASITKIMTCFLVLNIAKIFNLNIYTQKAIVSQKASKMPGTSANLNYSDILTVYQLLHGLMLPSGNDAAVALAEWGGKTIRKYTQLAQKYTIAKSNDSKSMNFITDYIVEKKSYQKLFILHMNKAANNLDLKNTRFINSHGLMNEKAYSTANDIALLTSIAMKNSIFTDVVFKKQFECKIFNRTYSQHSTISWKNTNKLLWTEGFIGVKTGVTPSAGPCLSSMFKINQVQSLVLIVFKTKSMELRFKQSLDLLKYSLKYLGYGKLQFSGDDESTTSKSEENNIGQQANLYEDQKQISSDQDEEDEEI